MVASADAAGGRAVLAIVGAAYCASLLLAMCLGGCNLALDLEKGRLQESATPECPDGTCAACGDPRDCDVGERCIDHTCRSALDSGVPFDGGLEAAVDSGDATNDAEVEPACRLTCAHAERCVFAEGRATCACLPGHQRVDGTCVACGEGDAGSCVPNAICTEVDKGRACTCKPGFEDVRGDGSECVDKCTLKGCLEEVATCSLVGEEAECACIADYVGDGIESCEFDAECSLLGCHEHATCEVSEGTRACKCKPGYEGTGTECENPDDCAPENPCQNGGRCTDGLNAFTCDCTGTGYTGQTCDQDINECTGRAVCGAKSRCVNEPGTYQCASCGTGYESSANGLECVDIDECQRGTHNCGPHGTCSGNTSGSYTCACDTGYTQTTGTDGRPSCTLSGACEAGLANCVEPQNHGVCTSTGGTGFTCACRAGYAGDGVKISAGGTGCTDMDECTSRDVCGTTRRCANTAGGYDCVNCPAGHESSANGLSCVDINECTGRSVCGAASRCVNTTGSYTCEPCNAGFQSSADGLSCVDVNECSNNPCQNGGSCSNTSGSYQCTCKSGWTGKNCQTDVNECLSQPCQNGGSCTNTPGGYSCACAPGWTGEHCTQPRCIQGDIECNPKTKNPEQCLADGSWLQIDICNIPAEICRDNQGCVVNEPADIGNVSVNAAWEPWQIPADRAYFIPIVVAKNWLLLNFRLHARVAGGVCRMALYEDSGNRPGAMLTYTTRDINVAAGVNGEAPTSRMVQMELGKKYWLGAKCWASSGPVELYQLSAASAAYFRTASTTYGELWADSPGGTSSSGVTFPFFMQVQEVP